MRMDFARSIAPELGSSTESSRGEGAIGSPMDAQTDLARDLLRAGQPRRAMALLEDLLRALPRDATSLDVFRIKANIGFCQVQLGDLHAGLISIDDAITSSPEEPKAIAVAAFAMSLRGRHEDAVSYARVQLALDPENVDLAAYLIEGSLSLEDADLDQVVAAVPLALREKERVCVALCHLHRTRNDASWWNKAKAASRRFPKNEILSIFAAEADVDELAGLTRSDNPRPFTDAELVRLQASARFLCDVWRRMKGSEVPGRTDGLSALGSAMIAWAIVGDRIEALALAHDLFHASDQVDVLLNVLQVATVFDDPQLADAVSAKLPADGRGGFGKGVRAFNAGDWTSAVRLFRSADVPPTERTFVATVSALEWIVAKVGPADPDEAATLEQARVAAEGDPRSLALVAQSAKRRSEPGIAERAFADALALIEVESRFADRAALSAYAQVVGDYDTVISLLDGGVAEDAFSPELQRLADAHASEQPPRERNLLFFKRLRGDLLVLPSIARAYGAVLVKAGLPGDAVPLLRRAVEAMPEDTYSVIALANALIQSGSPEGASALIARTDEAKLIGDIAHKAQFVFALRQAGEHRRALDFAYGLVRFNPGSSTAALAYIQQLIPDPGAKVVDEPAIVGTRCWVSLRSDDAQQDSFLIDDGPSFLGIEVSPPDGERARRVMGRQIGDTFESGSGAFTKRWSVAEVTSRYRHVLRVILNGFEARFPTDPSGVRSLRLQGESVQPVLDLLRDQESAKSEAVRRLYIEGRLPLGMVARATGQDVSSLAAYIRLIGEDVEASSGEQAARAVGRGFVAAHRYAGAVLDTFTAIACAEIGLLPLAADWFGSLVVAASTINEIDRMAARVSSLKGASSMSLAWIKGQAVRLHHDDAALDRQLEAISEVRGLIKTHCEVIHVVLPDDVEVELATLMREHAKDALDAIFLASSTSKALLSDDLHLREMARGLRRVEGTSLQPMIEVALDAGSVGPSEAVGYLAALAARRHGHFWIDQKTFWLVYDHGDERQFAAICTFIGGAKANLVGHWLLVTSFLEALWYRPSKEPKRMATTSLLVAAVLRGRVNDWPLWFALVWRRSSGELRAYLIKWLRGHFLSEDAVAGAVPEADRIVRGMAIPFVSPASWSAMMLVQPIWSLPREQAAPSKRRDGRTGGSSPRRPKRKQ